MTDTLLCRSRKSSRGFQEGKDVTKRGGTGNYWSRRKVGIIEFNDYNDEEREELAFPLIIFHYETIIIMTE